MSKAKMGATVLYCGHKGVFTADIFRVGSANVIRTNGPITASSLERGEAVASATHHVSDFPSGGFWRPDLGVLVVPEKQVVELTKKPAKRDLSNAQ